jgi:outer membrane receptor protein involved in Fe transport
LGKRDWNVKSFLKKSALRSASCLQALSITGLAIGAVAISAPAAAQDYTSGAVSGTVTNADGQAVPGASVTLSSNDTGNSRTTTSTSTGAFRFSTLTPGNYTLKVASEGAPDFTATDVRVVASQTAALNVALATGGQQEIVVTAAQIQQPFTGTTTGVTVDLEDLVTKVPIGRDITNVMLLAPGTSRGESTFGGKSANFVSINGSSVAENAYYINGLNITNFDNYLGGAEVPFDFYKSVEVKSGGYSAEFGRATGGIVNAVSKSGGNDFMAAMHLNWAPDWLRSDTKNLISCEFTDTTYTTTTCQPYTNRKYDKSNSYSAVVEASGPIIQDRLFVYGLLEMQHSQTLTNARTSSLAYRRESNDPFWAVKVDAYPLDDHHFEFTIFDSRKSVTQANLAYSEDADGKPSYGPSGATFNENSGGVNFVGKYTGHFADWLTLSAAYGRMRDRFDTTPVDLNAGAPYMSNASQGTINGVPNGGLLTAQTNSIVDLPYKIQRKFFRADADLFFTAFGDHHIRMGYDQENNKLIHTGVSPGQSIMCDSGFLSTAACTAGISGSGARLIFRAADATGDPIVEVNYYNTGGAFKARNRAAYIEDEWDVTDRLTLNLGVRRDDFLLDKGDGSVLVNLDKNYAPRLGATYDLFEDHSGKVKAFWGRYFLPVASNTSFRQASPELYIRERWYYNGFDTNGLPNLTGQVTNRTDYVGLCPIPLTSGSGGSYCNVTGDGTVPDTSAAISHNLKATRETEWILGYEQKFGDWTAGLTYTHRNLDISAEDMAIDAAVLAWCADNGVAGCSNTWTGYNQYVITNPGHDVIVNLRNIDPALDNTEVHFTADQLGYPKAKRTYDAVELSVKHPWNGKWSFEGNYTWSRAKGNSEGFVQSDFQQDDSGITQDFDQPGFLDGAYGYLPNHRRHRIKMYGAYAITDAFIVGSNVSIESPRPLSCFGYHPVDPVTGRGAFENGYGNASHYCGGTLSPRGTAQKSQWVSQIDLSGRYNIEIPTGQMVTLRVDIFNLLNSHAIQDRWEFGDADHSDATATAPEQFIPDANYHQARVYQSPRSVRLGVDVNF